MRNQDRFRGCLIGGAAGDALGYPVEFMSEGRIFQKYGEQGITAYKLEKQDVIAYELEDGEALISDDTQMTLFTAAGLLACTAREGSAEKTEANTETNSKFNTEKYTQYIHASYLDWLNTQEKRYPLPGFPRTSWLAEILGLYDLRAPGNTCLAALRSGRCGTIEEPLNDSKGCGGVMRVAPAGLYFNDRNISVKQVARIGADAAAVTHGHPLGWMPAAALAQIVHEVSQDDATVLDAVLHSLNTVDEMWPETKERKYFTRLMEKAIDLAAEDLDDLDAIHALGEGWVADEALAIAVYCALKYENDFDGCLIAAVNHKGDSDSTGAIAGNILGAKLGLSGIPEKYTDNLELKDVILEIADDLYYDCRPGKTPADAARIRKYLGEA